MPPSTPRMRAVPPPAVRDLIAEMALRLNLPTELFMQLEIDTLIYGYGEQRFADGGEHEHERTTVVNPRPAPAGAWTDDDEITRPVGARRI